MIIVESKEKFTKIFVDELILHKRMLLLLNTEKEFIVQQKIKELVRLISKKELLLKEIREKKYFWQNMVFPTDSWGLKIQREFKEILEKIKQTQEVNSYLLRQNIEFVQKHLSILNSPALKPHYSFKGNIKDELPHSQYLDSSY